MKILITGGTGFLGRHLVWRAAAEGAEVTFTGRNTESAKIVKQMACRPVVWKPLDHGSPLAVQALEEAAEGADVVIHCAALSTPWGTPESFWAANVVSTRDVLTAGHARDVRRLVHVSTPSVYFAFKDQLNIHEDDELPTPANDYVRTKRAAEELVRESPLPETVIVRPRALFGPWDQTLVPRLLRVMQRGPIPLMRGGNSTVDLTYIDNAVEAIWLAATHPLRHPISTYNITNNEPRLMRDLVEIMANEFGVPFRTQRIPWTLVKMVAYLLETQARILKTQEPLMTRYSAGVMAFSQTLNIDALSRELGYKPVVDIEEGIRRHARWWKSHVGNSN